MAIKLKTYTGAEITAKDDALLFDSIIGKSGIVYGCKVTHAGSNKINVATGKMLIKGRQVDITEQTVLATLASSGTQKGRLIVHMDLSNTSEPVKLVTQVGSTLPDLEQNDNCNENNGVYEYELATYTITATQITTNSLIQTAQEIGTNLADLNSSAIKIYTTTNTLAITVENCLAYVDVTVPLAAGGKIVAAVPVIVDRDWTTYSKSPISVGLQDKEVETKKRILLNATAKYSAVTVKIYWFYTGKMN